MQKFDQDIIKRAVLHYGIETESIVCMEECSELQKEISKYLRGQGNKTALLLEMADVLICIEMLKKMYNVPDEVLDDAIALKQRRIFRIIEERKAAEKDVRQTVIYTGRER